MIYIHSSSLDVFQSIPPGVMTQLRVRWTARCSGASAGKVTKLLQKLQKEIEAEGTAEALSYDKSAVQKLHLACSLSAELFPAGEQEPSLNVLPK